MSHTLFSLIDEQRVHEVPATVAGGCVRLTAQAIADTLGWTLESRGLCRGSVCVPTEGIDGLVCDDGVDLARFAEAVGRPLAMDVSESTAALGAPANERSRALLSLAAPDFTLPDLDGNLHSLSDHRGSKVLLIAHASW